MYTRLMDWKARFAQVYANLPLGMRNEIIAVVDGEPVTWKAANLEIEQNTKNAKKILDILIKLKILKEKNE